MPGGADGEAMMVTLMFGARGVGVPAFIGMPIRDLRAMAAKCADVDDDAIQLCWEGTSLHRDGVLGTWGFCTLACTPTRRQCHHDRTISRTSFGFFASRYLCRLF